MIVDVECDSIVHVIPKETDIPPCLVNLVPENIVYPVQMHIHEVHAVFLYHKDMDPDDEEAMKALFERDSVYLSKHQLDTEFLQRSYRRSDCILLLQGFVEDLVDGEEHVHTLPDHKIVLGFATMYRQRFSEFLYENKCMRPYKHVRHHSLVLTPCTHVLHINAMGTRYYLGGEMLRLVEHNICGMLECGMICVRTIPRSYFFYLKHGFLRTNDWCRFYPLNKGCDAIYAYEPEYATLLKQVVLEEKDAIFRGDGFAQGFLLTKYLGPKAVPMTDRLRSLQNGCVCPGWMKFLC